MCAGCFIVPARRCFATACLLSWAAAPRGAAAIQWRMLLSIADGWVPPRFPLTGREAMAIGLAEGPAMGQALAAVEAWWLEQDFLPDTAALLEKLKSVAGSRP